MTPTKQKKGEKRESRQSSFARESKPLRLIKPLACRVWQSSRAILTLKQHGVTFGSYLHKIGKSKPRIRLKPWEQVGRRCFKVEPLSSLELRSFAVWRLFHIDIN